MNELVNKPRDILMLLNFEFFAESQVDRSIGEKKPRLSGDKKPSLTELSGYNFKRQEFEIEYDNDAEQLLADMEFKDSDTNIERELKLRVLRIYSKRYLYSYYIMFLLLVRFYHLQFCSFNEDHKMKKEKQNCNLPLG